MPSRSPNELTQDASCTSTRTLVAALSRRNLGITTARPNYTDPQSNLSNSMTHKPRRTSCSVLGSLLSPRLPPAHTSRRLTHRTDIFHYHSSTPRPRSRPAVRVRGSPSYRPIHLPGSSAGGAFARVFTWSRKLAFEDSSSVRARETADVILPTATASARPDFRGSVRLHVASGWLRGRLRMDPLRRWCRRTSMALHYAYTHSRRPWR
ncbi:hypothetical protein L226DRAFT_74484 [Lentinus tigrinus ALCF2SS1-7]|uniref:Uncharacterized protein n=1 Tax=Lentinus tigrinus ALCF2SS1-6 TaxID=1328759 RepID=A0A5C2SFB1_9APHY|nr:hypothetical protein L227DRAFT_44792 [Lentinus tigrinus ALCF2SS1-6]RPD74444.1 hypothetical protein L226DRAFT_74484 [Lentinus tigrinus ALCF2SS1-7]